MARYDSFLLQVWRSNRRDGRQFSAKLEHLQNGKVVQCAGIEALLRHLQELLDADANESAETDQCASPDSAES